MGWAAGRGDRASVHEDDGRPGPVRVRQVHVDPAVSFAWHLGYVQEEGQEMRRALVGGFGDGQPVALPRRRPAQQFGQFLGSGEHRPVPGAEVEVAHPVVGECAELRRTRFHQHPHHVDAGTAGGAQDAGGRQCGGRAGQPERLGEGARRLWGREALEPFQRLGGDALGAAPAGPLARPGRRHPSAVHSAPAGPLAPVTPVTPVDLAAPCGHVRDARPYRRVRYGPHGRLAVLGQARVQGDDPGDTLGTPIGGAQDGVEPVAVSDEYDPGRVDVVDQPHQVVDVGLQIDGGSRPVVLSVPDPCRGRVSRPCRGPGSHPREGHGVRLRARRPERGHGLLPQPATREGARHQHERGHDRLLVIPGTVRPSR